MLQKIAPILQAINLSETNLFYKNKLKFLTYYYGNYLIVKKEGIEIHFVECKNPKNFIPSGCCIFDNNLEDLYAKYSSMDMIGPAGNLKNNPRGKKEFFIVDNNGNELRFCEL
ncbi:MAG: hypothetical protein ABI741_13660 [Ferruginibacter sp.]